MANNDRSRRVLYSIDNNRSRKFYNILFITLNCCLALISLVCLVLVIFSLYLVKDNVTKPTSINNLLDAYQRPKNYIYGILFLVICFNSISLSLTQVKVKDNTKPRNNVQFFLCLLINFFLFLLIALQWFKYSEFNGKSLMEKLKSTSLTLFIPDADIHTWIDYSVLILLFMVACLNAIILLAYFPKFWFVNKRDY